ncbi:MAG: metal-dependent hydrolase [Pseudomonadales bacterium]|nr:metal-dependent hydrolase [Pseudomonadales bacterium]
MPTTTINKPEIRARKMKFNFSDIKNANYWGGNAIVSSYFAAMSATFPPGEKEFIESVRLFQDRINDPHLKKEIKEFIGQEGQHSHQHRKINEAFAEQGWDTERIEGKLRNKIANLNRVLSDESRLARTVCFEHITAIMSEFILENQEVLDDLPESLKSLFLWHTVEEIEHKSVAFDVYETLVGDRNHLRRHMALVTIDFSITMLYYQVLAHIWARSLPSWSDLKGAWKFFFGKKGMISNMRQPYLNFYRKDFHPWEVDNSDLIAAWKASKYADMEISKTTSKETHSDAANDNKGGLAAAS